MNWKCPYCGNQQVITKDNSASFGSALNNGSSRDDRMHLTATSIRCLNDDCKRQTLIVYTSKVAFDSVGNIIGKGKITREWNLLPESIAKPQPIYIPAPLVQDYNEACLIAGKSPKASATLARRCLQGMIRDFCGISKNRLVDEIAELRKQVNDGTADRSVSPETIDAIDAIRNVGNIGAHMEKDISLIVDVDEGEAQTLISLIEVLFEEWYVARHVRQQKLAGVQALAQAKETELQAAKAAKAAKAAGIVPTSAVAPTS